jgi:hypothetical protein
MSYLSKMKNASKTQRNKNRTDILSSVDGGGKKSYKDDRFWKPTVESNGKGYAVLRFLQGKPGELAITHIYEHGYQGPGGWYIKPCATTVGERCPVCEANREITNAGGGWDVLNESDKKLVRQRKRKESYIANVLVIEDDKNPNTVGKVYLYKFGKSIFNKIKLAMSPEFEGDESLDPFDLWEGGNFRLKINKKEGWRNYDLSEFGRPYELFNGDETQLMALMDNRYDLAEFTESNPTHFPTLEEATEQFERASLSKTSRSSNDTNDENVEVLPNVETTDKSSASMMDYFKAVAD